MKGENLIILIISTSLVGIVWYVASLQEEIDDPWEELISNGWSGPLTLAGFVLVVSVFLKAMILPSKYLREAVEDSQAKLHELETRLRAEEKEKKMAQEREEAEEEAGDGVEFSLEDETPGPAEEVKQRKPPAKSPTE